MKVKKINKKNILLVIGVLLFTVIVGSTVAFYGWSTNRTDQNRTIDVALSSGTGVCEKITDNNKKLIPVAKKENGRIITIRANHQMADNAYITWDLNVNSIDAGLRHQTYKYELVDMTTGVLYGKGSFENSENNSTITLNNLETLDKNTDYIFTLYLWIDGTIGENPLSMADQNYDFDINCNITGTDNNLKSAVYKITSLYNNSAKEEVTQTGANMTYHYANIYGEYGGLMNDRLGSMSTNIDDGNIRYYGADPNNYMYFNCTDYENQSDSTCELWRIIGVFSTDDGAGNIEKRLKIIRNDSIGSYSWDTSASGINSGSGINQWGSSEDYAGADLMKLLNPGYEDNKKDGTTTLVNNSLYWNRQSGTCFGGGSNSTKSCNFATSGITNTTKGLISDAVWYLGGISSSSIYANEAYTSERGNTVVVPGTTCSGTACNDTVTRTLSWTGKGGLMYVSDYGYAADLNKCTTLNSYNSSTNNYECRSNDWLYNGNNQRTIVPPALDANYVWVAYSDGSAYATIASNSNAVRPVYYLNSSSIITAGDGSSNNPYKLLVG